MLTLSCVGGPLLEGMERHIGESLPRQRAVDIHILQQVEDDRHQMRSRKVVLGAARANNRSQGLAHHLAQFHALGRGVDAREGVRGRRRALPVPELVLGLEGQGTQYVHQGKSGRWNMPRLPGSRDVSGRLGRHAVMSRRSAYSTHRIYCLGKGLLQSDLNGARNRWFRRHGNGSSSRSTPSLLLFGLHRLARLPSAVSRRREGGGAGGGHGRLPHVRRHKGLEGLEDLPLLRGHAILLGRWLLRLLRGLLRQWCRLGVFGVQHEPLEGNANVTPRPGERVEAAGLAEAHIHKHLHLGRLRVEGAGSTAVPLRTLGRGSRRLRQGCYLEQRRGPQERQQVVDDLGAAVA